MATLLKDKPSILGLVFFDVAATRSARNIQSDHEHALERRWTAKGTRTGPQGIWMQAHTPGWHSPQPVRLSGVSASPWLTPP